MVMSFLDFFNASLLLIYFLIFKALKYYRNYLFYNYKYELSFIFLYKKKLIVFKFYKNFYFFFFLLFIVFSDF